MKKECNAKRQPFGYGVLGFNVVFLALLLVSLVLMILFQRKELFAIPGRINDTSQRFVSFVMVGFCIGIVASVFGIGTSCIKHRLLSVLFGAFLLPVPILYFMAMAKGSTFLKHSRWSAEDITSFCNKVATEQNPLETAENQVLFDYAASIDSKWQAAANKWMCSTQCPCESTVAT